MKKFKKMMVGLVLAVTLLGNCISVYAAADGVCDSCNKAMTLYEKQYLYKEFWETHTEQHGAITVVCTKYKYHYIARYRCDNHTTTVFEVVTAYDEVHEY